MPNSGKPNHPQAHNGGSGPGSAGAGGLQGARDKAGEVGQNLQEKASQVGQHVREGVDSARESLEHGYRQTEGAIARNPTQSVLVGFGVGFGLGVLLTVLMSREEERPWYERYTDSLRNLPDHVRDSLKHAHIPESVSRHIDALRGVPEALARHLPDSLHR